MGRTGASRGRSHSVSSGVRPFALHTSTQSGIRSGAQRTCDRIMSPFLGPLDSDGCVPALQQTRLSAFLVSAHGAQTRQLAIALPWSLNNGWQVELHSQYCREIEILSVIGRSTEWVADPTLAFVIWQWEAAWLPRAADGVG